MGKRKDRNQELEQHSRLQLRMLLTDWVVNPLQEEDYAFDFEIRPIEPLFGPPEVEPSPMFAQLKASESFDHEDAVWWDFDTSYLLDDVLQASVPGVLFIYERQRDGFSWCVLQEYCWDVLDEERDGWRDQTTVRVRIDWNPIEDAFEKERLKRSVESVQRRISSREYIATVRRETFTHPSGTTLASSQTVSDYKQDLVDQAEHLAEAGHEDRALELLLRVYQMPEDDEPTLRAIRLLLNLREMNDCGIAFVKLQLAHDGRMLAEQYDRPALLDEFNEVMDTAWEYLATEFIGARYLNEAALLDLLVLEVSDVGMSGGGPNGWIATVQYGGELDTERAGAIATVKGYRLIESGAGRQPREDACEERSHEFDEEALREYALFASCANCGLSYDTIQQWLGHDVPEICERCGSVVYETVIVRDSLFCTDCA